MAYSKTVWNNNTPPDISAENLNKMEQGIEDAQFPDGGLTGQMLVKTGTGYGWDDIPESAQWGNITGQLSEQTDLYSELNALTTSVGTKITAPSGGTTGQYLQKTASGTQWATVQGGDSKIEKDVTLASASWSSGSYTISDADIGADSTVFLTYPATTSDADFEILQSAGIRATAQAAGSITFKATGDVPASDVVITMIIWG